MFWRRERRGVERQTQGGELFDSLRSQVMALDPSGIGTAPSADLPRVFGVLMDTGFQEGTATFVALADGTTSFYTSTGGGVIGAGRHEPVLRANRQLLHVAEAHLHVFEPGDATRLPAAGRVQLTVLTCTGRLRAETAEEDLGRRRRAASPVFHAMHAVITALREAESVHNTSGEHLPRTPTPLMAAAYGRDREALERLIEQGVPIEAHDDSGYTALMYAANAGRDDAVRILLARGADPNATDDQGSTPLMFAAQHGHVDIVRQLLAVGGDPNVRGSHGFTALRFARQNGHDRAAAVLTEAGAPD